MNFKRLGAIVAIPALALAAWAAWPAAKAPKPPAPVAKQEPVLAPESDEEVAPESVELALALEQKSVVAEFMGNGREMLKVKFMNKSNAPLQIVVPLGQVFDGVQASSVITVQAAVIDVPAGKMRDYELHTAALHSTGTVGPSPFKISYATLPKLTPLLRQVQQHPEITRFTTQTAVLALTENLPVSALSKFSPAAGTLPSRFNTDPFRVETLDLMRALVLLRELGVREASLALTIDPQLKIEAMIDPAARPVAMRYYGIASETEWEFWRRELLQGEPSTRHYALYGIARFYPDVALQMLPRWARETRTNPVYRLSAVQALADTQRPEALPILRQLALDLIQHQELSKAATGAADYLDYQLAQVAAARNAVAFRTARKSSGDLAVAKN